MTARWSKPVGMTRPAWPLCLHEVRPHHLCTLRLDHKGTCLAVPSIPKSGAA